MRLVELLAREWSEWPSNCDYAVCDSDGEIRAIGTGTHNDFYPATAVDLEDRLNGTALLVSDDGKRVTRTDWAAERARIAKPAKKADKDGWIRHRGGKCPVAKGVRVDVRYRAGAISENQPAMEKGKPEDKWAQTWEHSGHIADIMAYRIHKPSEETTDEKVMRECVEKCASTESLDDSSYTIINDFQLQKIGQIEGPLMWRNRIAEIDTNSKTEEERHCAVMSAFDTERADLVQKLAGEGFALIGRINELLTEAAQKHEDMSDFRNWKVGDLVQVIDPESSGLLAGKAYPISKLNKEIDEEDEIHGLPCLLADGYTWLYAKNMRWHSRPSA